MNRLIYSIAGTALIVTMLIGIVQFAPDAETGMEAGYAFFITLLAALTALLFSMGGTKCESPFPSDDSYQDGD